jgi:hypothetical protein
MPAALGLPRLLGMVAAGMVAAGMVAAGMVAAGMVAAGKIPAVAQNRLREVFVSSFGDVEIIRLALATGDEDLAQFTINILAIARCDMHLT